MADEETTTPAPEDASAKTPKATKPAAKTKAAKVEAGKTAEPDAKTEATKGEASKTAKPEAKTTKAEAGDSAKAETSDAAAVAPAEGAAEGAPAAEDGEAAEPARERRRVKSLPPGIAHIKATFNNTMVSICDTRGNVVAWSSAGRAGFKGSRKSTAFAATVVGQEAARAVVSKGMREVAVQVQGPGAGRESAIRALQSAGLGITMIKDVTPMPHNGCRPRKRRRV